MAKAKKSAKEIARKPAPKTAARPVKSVLSKSALVQQLSGTSGAAAKDVRAVIAALEETIRASISKKGPRTFVLPHPEDHRRGRACEEGAQGHQPVHGRGDHLQGEARHREGEGGAR